MKVQLLLCSVTFVAVATALAADYATTETLPTRRSERQQRQHSPLQIEANATSNTKKTGKFIMPVPTNQTRASSNMGIRQRNIGNGKSRSRVSISQYDIPLIDKQDKPIKNSQTHSSITRAPAVTQQRGKLNATDEQPDRVEQTALKDVRRAHKGTRFTTAATATKPPRSTAVQHNNNNNFVQNFANNLFSTNFWNFSQQPNYKVETRTSTTAAPVTIKHPPKKYLPTPAAAVALVDNSQAKQIKSHYRKKTTTDYIITTTSKPHLDGPFRIALPTITFPSADKKTDKEKDKRNTAAVKNLRDQFECPRESEVRFQLFPKICKSDKDCSVWGRDEICCEIFGAKSCVSGMNKPLEEAAHTPILGLIPRKCPSRPLAELWWDVQECQTDMDCWPRVCCPDGLRRYCRTSQPELETAPVPVKRSFNYLTEYLECTPPPPPVFDLHPKTCTSTLDCFPNVCCQEAGLRHCRPPKKSVLTLMANFLNVDFVKRLAQNIVIK